ncbi:Response regulator c-di-GMP phosphodiesterase, RpfG family, contains REC and HD-GYP domains [Tindallia magadiensis]|uniref:Stage 0 sporulation protein A homolog n=1 Tax=Tindallia magadiensis TaxID=69895 RepID=A0A1I3H9V8_9FIRM|nr:HD domain-containing phosphohydrolase [Tindallia magadiensis]SFI32548.1 Response regulator c-di-GMP phosphodiesterase, RpfG family, contains REC and HD-GYP domains [Tindallia magadiensis]
MPLPFLSKEPKIPPITSASYKIMVADDDPEVHQITRMMLADFTFEGKGLEFINTYSGQETIEVLQKNPDTAILFLDVVMESNASGLEVVDYLRKELNNQMTRIILRTGQPGEAPEEEVIRQYDINDYRLKTEMTMKRLYTSTYAALRSYRDLSQIDQHRKGLEKIIRASSQLFEHQSLNEFLTSILDNLASFNQDENDMLFLSQTDGFLTLKEHDASHIMAATGKYKAYLGKKISEVAELEHVLNLIESASDKTDKIIHTEKGFLVKNDQKSLHDSYIFIEGAKEIYNFDLINLFLSNYDVALDRFIMEKMVSKTQKELIITLGEIVESHFDETAGHVRRISEMMYQFATLLEFPTSECEMIKIASTMHDIGKIAIPDHIIKKKGKLTPEEFDVIKHHPVIGHKILSKSELSLLKASAEIALYHHERFDGSGYPEGLSGEEIPLRARMLAIVDVFDAMSHKRVYKEAAPLEDVMEYLESQAGKHFDPELLAFFIKHLDIITQV